MKHEFLANLARGENDVWECLWREKTRKLEACRVISLAWVSFNAACNPFTPPPSFFAYPRFRVCFQRMKVYSKLLFMNGKMCVCLVCHCISFLTQHQGKAKTASPHTHTSTPSSNKTEQNTKDQNNHSGVILDGRVFIPGFFCFVFPLTQRIISLVCELFFK